MSFRVAAETTRLRLADSAYPAKSDESSSTELSLTKRHTLCSRGKSGHASRVRRDAPVESLVQLIPAAVCGNGLYCRRVQQSRMRLTPPPNRRTLAPILATLVAWRAGCPSPAFTTSH